MLPGVSPQPASLESLSPHHTVQFYEDDAYLFRVVSRYLSKGLKAGQPVVVIATPEHCDGFLYGLAALGHDPGLHQRGGGLIMMDAKAALASFIAGSMPSSNLFYEHIGKVVESVRRKRKGCTIRIYGEMVDILWEEGKPEAAIRLEELWNELSAEYALSLLCGHSMATFAGDTHGTQFQEICARHAHVLPTERFMEVQGEGLRLREISHLQQRARALEAEIARRQHPER